MVGSPGLDISCTSAWLPSTICAAWALKRSKNRPSRGINLANMFSPLPPCALAVALHGTVPRAVVTIQREGGAMLSAHRRHEELHAPSSRELSRSRRPDRLLSRPSMSQPASPDFAASRGPFWYFPVLVATVAVYWDTPDVKRSGCGGGRCRV